MNKELSKLIDTLESLKQTLDSKSITDANLSSHGWNQVHITKVDLLNYLSNHINQLKCYKENSIPKGLEQSIGNHIANVNNLEKQAKSYFTNTPSHLISFVPVILLTLHTIFDDINHELFSYENIQEKKLLPRSLSNRLRGIRNSVDSLEQSKQSLKSKIDVINDAHEAAESLPTDLASLKDAKAELRKTLEASKKEVEELKGDVEKAKDDALILKSKIESDFNEVNKIVIDIKAKSENADLLVQNCDDALQIATTQGLAAGFDQKAQELRRSIWVWIVGLLIALFSGAWIGSDRVDAFTLALTQDITAGQAILHTIMSVFSIGGPLWLAWISTRQINHRFKLSEDYSYKATVAKSFTGFKKFAERFDSATEERLFNSTLDRFDELPLRLVEDKDHSSPWHEFTDSEAFKEAVKTVPTLAKEVAKFASKAKLKRKPQARPEHSEPKIVPAVKVPDEIVESQQ